VQHKFTLKPVEDWALWDKFVNDSPQGSLFFLSTYLQSTDLASRAWFVWKGSTIRAGLCIQEASGGNECRLNDLVIHNGLWFLASEDHKLTNLRDERFEITKIAIAFLTDQYSSVELALAPQVEDVRPFLWYNYHGPPEEQFRLSLRYTSYLNIQEMSQLGNGEEDCAIFRQLKTIRQRNLRKAVNAHNAVHENGSIESLLNNYARTMGLSTEEFAPTRDRMATLMESLCDHGMGKLYEVMDDKGNPAYGVFFAWDNKRAYYLFGAGDPDRYDTYQGTFVFWEALRNLATCQGITEIDWEGVNSPTRGWFKLTFGGTLVPYYELRWTK